MPSSDKKLKFSPEELAALQAGLLLLGDAKALPREIHDVATNGGHFADVGDALINTLLIKLLEEEKHVQQHAQDQAA